MSSQQTDRRYRIAVIPGDGIGPEVIDIGVAVLKRLAQQEGFDLAWEYFPFGGEHTLKTGKVLDDEEVRLLKTFDAIYLGAIGHPKVKPGVLERGILLKLRFDLDLYINLRPIRLYEGVPIPIKDVGAQDIDYVIVRENTGGLYTGIGRIEDKDSPEETAVQEMIYTRHQVERCVRFAFDLCRRRHRNTPFRGLSEEELKDGKIGRVTLCGKTNVLTYVFDLWQRVFDETAARYPDIATDYVHVDAMCVHMIENPKRFDVVVTENMFGDIITDLGAVTQGGMGMAPSANLNPGYTGLFEPVHGSAPDIAGQGKANPIAAVLSGLMMLETLGEEKAAERGYNAVQEAIRRIPGWQKNRPQLGTRGIGDLILNAL